MPTSTPPSKEHQALWSSWHTHAQCPDLMRDWFGEDTPRCWSKLADLFDDCPYFTVTEITSLFAVMPTPAVRLNVGMLIREASAARASVMGNNRMPLLGYIPVTASG